MGVPHDVKGEVAWIFCVAAPGHEPSEALAEEVAANAASALGKAFKPDGSCSSRLTEDAQRQDRPPGRSGAGPRRDPGDLSSVENPEVLEDIARAV